MSPALSLCRLCALSITGLVAGACLNGTELVSPPRVPVTSFTLEFRADSEDLASATALGWANGIPGVQVTLAPEDSANGVPQVYQGSDSGTLTLGQLQAGRYRVDAVRWLTDAERARLPAGDDALGFVARILLSTASASARVPIGMVASRRKGLVISEWAFNIAAFVEVNETYFFGGFLELYNNADTTVYLDGLIIARGFSLGFDYPNYPCTLEAVFANDPQGIWAREVEQFPGRGRDYPVRPGGLVLVAIDAIDHSRLISRGLDLSHADFEFWGGPADIDNPAVPNMIDTLALGHNGLGHGTVFQGLSSVAVLAHPYDLATVPRQTGLTGEDYVRISAEQIVDVVTLWPNYVSQYGPRCPQLVNSRFDRASFDGRGYDENVEYDYSISRRRVPVSGIGLPLLQRSRNSDADFIRTLRSPGSIP